MTSSASAEQPSSSARMRFRLRPVEIEGTAEGEVPAGEAHALITTFGMIAMGVAGITAAAITLFTAPSHALGWFFGLALAELAVTVMVIALIARRERGPAGKGLAGAAGGRGQRGSSQAG